MGQSDQEALSASLLADALDDFAAERISAGEAPLAAEEEGRLVRAVLDELFGSGSRLQPYREDPSVIEIRANDWRTTWILYADGRKERGPALAADKEGFIELVRALLEEARRYDGIERRFDAAWPWVDCVLANGDRVFALRDLAREPFLVIRRHNFDDLAFLDQLVANGTLSALQGELFDAMVRAKFNIVFEGGFGCGKTVLLRCCCNAIPPEERKIVLEDVPELGLERFPDRHPDLVSVYTRAANVEGAGAVSMADLAYRLHRAGAGRFLVGEARGRLEVLPMLMAMMSGNEGSMTTVHAPSTAAALDKLALYASMADEHLSLEQANRLIASAVEFVVHLQMRTRRGRVDRAVSSIRRVGNTDDAGRVTSDEVMRRGPDGRAVAVGDLGAEALERLDEVGFDVDALATEATW